MRLGYKKYVVGRIAIAILVDRGRCRIRTAIHRARHVVGAFAAMLDAERDAEVAARKLEQRSADVSSNNELPVLRNIPDISTGYNPVRPGCPALTRIG